MSSPSPTLSAGRSGIDVRGLTVSYATDTEPVTVVRDVDVSVAPGTMLGLVGESGSGKSSLGRGIIGLLPEGAERHGSVVVNGHDLAAMTPERLRRHRGRDVGLVFQEPMTRLDPLMRVSDHFTEALRAHEPRLPRREIRRRSLEALRAVAIPPTRFDQYPHEFSGGMRQRIMIALVLVTQPSVIIADEVTTALDVMVEAQIVELLSSLRDSGVALMLITHNLGLVAEACDEVAVMYAGRIVERGPVDEVFRSPRHPYTKRLLGSTISIRTTELTFIDGSPPDPRDLPSGCSFHPRCPFATDICRVQIPHHDVDADGREFECWHPHAATNGKDL
jgi:peptide/nickel transport system ATP-binding protein